MNKKPGGERRETDGVKSIPQLAFHSVQAKGFTLLEVLLALAILAMIATAIYGTFSTVGNNVKQAEEAREGNDLARTLLARLMSDFANVYINGSMNTSTVALTIFYGNKEEVGEGEEKIRHDAVTMTTLTNWRKLDSPEMELWEVGYSFKEKPDGTGYVLVRREKRELNPDVPALDGGVEYELTDAVEGLQLRYYDGSKWVDDWDSRQRSNQWPKAAEITLTLADGQVYVTQADIWRL